MYDLKGWINCVRILTSKKGLFFFFVFCLFCFCFYERVLVLYTVSLSHSCPYMMVFLNNFKKIMCMQKQFFCSCNSQGICSVVKLYCYGLAIANLSHYVNVWSSPDMLTCNLITLQYHTSASHLSGNAVFLNTLDIRKLILHWSISKYFWLQNKDSY